VIDPLAALALSKEPPREKLSPQKEVTLVTRQMIMQILGMALFQVAILMTVAMGTFESSGEGRIHDGDGSPLS